MASQRIPIEDHGEPNETDQWVDRLGRSWLTSHWVTKYNNTLFSSHCTPTPEGIICFLDHNYASQKLQGYMHFVRENILEINLSYKGSAEEWIEFLSLPKELIPSFLKPLSVKLSKGRITIKSEDWSINSLPWSQANQNPINVLISYDPTKELAMRVHGLEVVTKKTPREGFLLIKAHEVSGLAPDDAIERWENIEKRQGPYNGQVQQRGDELRLRKIAGPRIKMRSPRLNSSEHVRAQWIMSCFSPLNSSRKELKQRCNKTYRSMRFP